MASALFQSFRGSGMPKRLLRYALARLDLLDAEALDMDNLDLAWGRNTILEFRDVGIKLEKLRKLLSLPPTLDLYRAKVLLLRVTIPVDFYTSPIAIEVDRVDVRLRVIGDGSGLTRPSHVRPQDPSSLVPNTADLAQSFLQTQPLSERRQLEHALAAESIDLGASVAASSDDGSEDESHFGTGQPLSLPGFLSDFLQGVVDRTQVTIKNVAFQLDLDVPAEPNSSRLEPISLQITLGQIEVDGITAGTKERGKDGSPPASIVHHEGKRHVSLASVRACLISEADALASFARSPSTASASFASSPAMTTRNPPSKQSTTLSSRRSFHEQQTPPNLEKNFGKPSSDDAVASDEDQEGCSLADSEDALEIPYDMSDVEHTISEDHGPDEEQEEGEREDPGPSTPRASTYLDLDDSPLHFSAAGSFSVTAPAMHSQLRNPTSTASGFPHIMASSDAAPDNLFHAEHHLQANVSDPTAFPETSRGHDTDPPQSGAASASLDDLTLSQLYTHEEAESMYMSAFSHSGEPDVTSSVPDANSERSLGPSEETTRPSEHRYRLQASDTTNPSLIGRDAHMTFAAEQRRDTSRSLPSKETWFRPPVMPGAWDDDTIDATPPPHFRPTRRGNAGGSDSDSTTSSPAFSRAASSLLPPHDIQDFAADTSAPADEGDAAATPRGPPQLVKEILRLDNVSIYLQSRHETHLHVDMDAPGASSRLSQSTMGQSSIFPQAPGAFSTHNLSSATSPKPASQEPDEATSSGSIEVTLSPLTVRFDASIAFLLAMLVERLLQSLKSPTVPSSSSSSPPPQTANEAAVARVRLAAKEITINFLNRLGGIIQPADPHADPHADPPPFNSDQEVLLNMTLSNLNVSSSSSSAASSKGRQSMLASKAQLPKQTDDVFIKLELEKFRFGYARGDILSFDSTRLVNTSIRDSFIPTGQDISVEILKSGDIIRTSVETLPLVVQIDLQRLDETFGWFGGLSGFLNMSSSMTSSPVPAPPSRSSARCAAPPPGKPRGVRFDTPIDPRDRSATSQNKTNIRIGGTLVELVGKDCNVSAETSALKLVSRDEGVGLGCSRLRVSGPFLRDSSAEPAITTEMGGLRLEFLTAPTDSDLEKLLELIIPSRVKFDHGDDEVMVDTLLRQRRKGSVLRATLDTVNVSARNIAQLSALPALGDEVAKLAAVAKYLPEDDRPGLLTLTRIQKLTVDCELSTNIGRIDCDIRELEVGQITVPSLVAVAVHSISVRRNGSEELVGASVFDKTKEAGGPSPAVGVDGADCAKGPVLMVRMIGDEIEPIVKLKLQDLRFEYRVTTVMDFLGLGSDATPQDFEAGLAASVANFGDHAHTALARESSLLPGLSPVADKPAAAPRKPTILDIGLRDCAVGLNPYRLPSKMVVALTEARAEVVLPANGRTKASVSVGKASVLLTDDASQADAAARRNSVTSSAAAAAAAARPRTSCSASRHVEDMCACGFVDICYVSSASVVASVFPDPLGDDDAADDDDKTKRVEIELRDDLLVMETCADSTQTLITLVNALKPPTPPTRENKFRTKVLPVQDLLASISAEAFGRPEGDYDFDQDFAGAQEMAGSEYDDDFGSDRPLTVDSDFYSSQSGGEEIFDATKSVVASQDGGALMEDTDEHVILLTGLSQIQDAQGRARTQAQSTGSELSSHGDAENLVVHDNFYSESLPEEPNAKIWNSNNNTYDRVPAAVLRKSPFKVSVRDVHVIWNLFDGYDWANTRDVIAKAVDDVETRMTERQSQQQRAGGAGRGRGGMPAGYDEDIEDEEMIGDFLFNSIYIGIPSNRDSKDLARAINEGLHDDSTETESVLTAATTTTVTANTNSRTAWRSRIIKSKRRLRLNRSKHHKITFELKGVNVDMVVFPPETGETVSSIDVRVEDFDIFDHVPTSTWKKFATYDQDHGEREMGTSMVRIELLNVKPIPQLAASEMVVRATVLPLRLHVDQDALDFITRFFEFKDDKVPVHASPSDVPFLQRAEVMDIPVKLDFKPKRVDYGGLRSGHTTEFMNFIVLDESRMVLRHVIIYGVAGFDRLGKTLNDIWMPDVRNNQLPGVLAGLAPVRSLVNIGSGFRDLVEIPLREYRKDGRVIRSISKGAFAFARTTGTELVKLGAKLAVGTQYALQGAEELLTDRKQPEGSWEEDDVDPEDKKQISLYADQPTGVLQGLRGGIRSLTRDVNLARDAIIAVPGEVMATQSATGAARAVLSRAPTIIFRPAVGVSKAFGQALMGATNSLDQDNLRKVSEKYKH